MESETLFSAADIWPEDPSVDQANDASELLKYVFCGVTAVVLSQPAPDHNQFNSWREVLEATARELYGVADFKGHPNAEDYRQAERLILLRAQIDSFPKEYSLLKAGKPVPRCSRLLTLSPEVDESGDLILVGGRQTSCTKDGRPPISPFAPVQACFLFYGDGLLWAL